MKRTQNVGSTLDRLLARFSTPSSDRVQTAIDRVGERLRLGIVEDSDDVVSRPGELGRGRNVAPMMRVRGFRALSFVAAAAVVLVAVGISGVFAGMWALRDRDAAATVEAIDGSLYRMSGSDSHAVATGDSIRISEVLRTNGGAGAQLALIDGSRVEMRSQSELALERVDDGVLVRLSRGGIIVNAAKQQAGHLYVRTKDMTVSVVGTVFLVTAEAQGSWVAVIEGEVRVRQGAEEQKLLPGEQVATNPLMVSPPVIDEISWSRNAPAHLALLQQSLAVSQPPVAMPPAPALQEPKVAREAFEVASVRRRQSTGGGGGRGEGVLAGGHPPACYGSLGGTDAGRLLATNFTVYQLITLAYDRDCAQSEKLPDADAIAGGPDWIFVDRFDIEATIPEGPPAYTTRQLTVVGRPGGPALKTYEPGPRLREMLQTLLAERFKLVLRHETRERPVYLLTVGKGGPKFTEQWAPGMRGMRAWKEGEPVRAPAGFGMGRNRDGVLAANVAGTKGTMVNLAESLALVTLRPVLDRTGIVGDFNYLVEFAPPADRSLRELTANSDAPVLTGPSLFTALEEQLGLKLESARAPVESLVIERVERLTEN